MYYHARILLLGKTIAKPNGESGTLTVSAVRFVARGRCLCANRSAFVVSPGI